MVKKYFSRLSRSALGKFKIYLKFLLLLLLIPFIKWDEIGEFLIRKLSDSLPVNEHQLRTILHLNKTNVSIRVDAGRSDTLGLVQQKQRNFSDILYLTQENNLVRAYEYYGVGKSVSIKDNLMTALFFERSIPTNIAARVLDLNDDGYEEIVVWVTNQVYGFHSDELVAFFILDHKGDIVVSAPLPQKIPDLTFSNTESYSAYGKRGTLIEKNTKIVIPLSYVNLVYISRVNKEYVLSFGWVIDTAPYANEHLYQIDSYTFDGEKLKNTEPYEKFLFVTGLLGSNQKVDIMKSKKVRLASSNKEIVRFFLESENVPPFKTKEVEELVKEVDKLQKECKASSDVDCVARGIEKLSKPHFEQRLRAREKYEKSLSR